jgi:hypothetical protein
MEIHIRNVCEVENGQGPVESVAGEVKVHTHTLDSGIAYQTVRMMHDQDLVVGLTYRRLLCPRNIAGKEV